LLLEEEQEGGSGGFGLVADLLGFLFAVLLFLVGLDKFLLIGFFLEFFYLFAGWVMERRFILNFIDHMVLLFFCLLNSVFKLKFFPAVNIGIQAILILFTNQVTIEIVLFLFRFFLPMSILVPFTAIVMIEGTEEFAAHFA
jgi:hypothetical protein